MEILATISFTGGWTHTRSAQDSSVVFTKKFDLKRVDYCVNYRLQIDRLPAETSVQVNGQPVVMQDDGEVLSADITYFVALGKNLLAITMRLAGSASETPFGSVQLQMMPCT
jgi:hypothetical protein